MAGLTRSRSGGRARFLALAAVVLAIAACTGTPAGSGAAQATGVPRPTSPAATRVPATAPSAAVTTSAPSPSMAPTALVDACSLVTQEEAEAIAGTNLLDKEATTPGSCMYAQDPNGSTGQFEVYVDRSAEGFLVVANEPVEGLGDEAYYSVDQSLIIRRGDTWLILRLVRLGDAAQFRSAMIELGRKALDRL